MGPTVVRAAMIVPLAKLAACSGVPDPRRTRTAVISMGDSGNPSEKGPVRDGGD